MRSTTVSGRTRSTAACRSHSSRSHHVSQPQEGGHGTERSTTEPHGPSTRGRAGSTGRRHGEKATCPTYPSPPPAWRVERAQQKQVERGGGPRVSPQGAPVRPGWPVCGVESSTTAPTEARAVRKRRRHQGLRVYTQTPGSPAPSQGRMGTGAGTSLPPSSRDGPVSTSSRHTLARKTARFLKDISILTSKTGSLKSSRKSPWRLRSVTPGGHGTHALPESFRQTLALRDRFHTADTGLWCLCECCSRGLGAAQAAGGCPAPTIHTTPPPPLSHPDPTNLLPNSPPPCVPGAQPRGLVATLPGRRGPTGPAPVRAVHEVSWTRLRRAREAAAMGPSVARTCATVCSLTTRGGGTAPREAPAW